MKRLCALSGLALLGGAALAQGTITDGEALFQFFSGTSGERMTADGGEANFSANEGTTDHVFQNWWWFRVDNVDTREYALSGLTSQSYVGAVATLTFTEPEGIDFTLVYTITDLGGNSATLVASLTALNNSGRAMDLNLFNYVDYDVGGSFGNDSATLLGPAPNARMRITDGGGPDFTEFLGVGFPAWEVDTWANVSGRLADGFINNYSNTGLPFGPADWTGAYQWRIRQLRAGQSVTVVEGLSINTGAVPEPATLLALGPALAALAARRRRK